MSAPKFVLSEKSKAALERLIAIAQSDTHQSRHVANFLLAWWNASENGGFDLVELWSVDQEIAVDMLVVFALIASSHRYPDSLGYKKDFEAIWKQWREGSQMSDNPRRCSTPGCMVELHRNNTSDKCQVCQRIATRTQHNGGAA